MRRVAVDVMHIIPLAWAPCVLTGFSCAVLLSSQCTQYVPAGPSGLSVAGNVSFKQV